MKIRNASYNEVNVTDIRSRNTIEEDFKVHSWVSQERNDYYLTIKILPFKYTEGKYLQLQNFDLTIDLSQWYFNNADQEKLN